MKANKYKRFLEFVAVLCLFLALGVDWFKGVDPMPNQTVYQNFSITSEYSSYIPPQIAEQAVEQAIAAAKRREKRGQRPTAKFRVGIMGETYTVENLRFDGFGSWIQADKKTQFKDTKKAQQVQDIVAAYCDYYRMCKGVMPEAVHLTESQFLALGANPGDSLYIGQSGQRAGRVVLLSAGGRS